jgi:zinc protease
VATVDASITMTQEGLSGSASPRDLETLFELVWLRMTAPRADTTAFRAFIGNVRSAIANRGADPDAVFSDTLSVTLSNHHPRTRPITPERIDSLDLGTAYAFYRDRYADASDFTFAIVGAFQLDSIRPMVERWLGALPATQRKENWRDPGIESPRGVIERVVRKGVEPRGRTQIVFTGPMPYSRAERAVIRGLGSVLESGSASCSAKRSVARTTSRCSAARRARRGRNTVSPSAFPPRPTGPTSWCVRSSPPSTRSAPTARQSGIS